MTLTKDLKTNEMKHQIGHKTMIFQALKELALRMSLSDQKRSYIASSAGSVLFKLSTLEQKVRIIKFQQQRALLSKLCIGCGPSN